MGKFYGSIAFFLTAVILTYFMNLPAIEYLTQKYLLSDPDFLAPYIIAIFELLHYPLDYLLVIPAWLIAGFLGGLITRSRNGAIIISLITGAILSLTWIFLMSRYLPNYWANFLSIHTTLEFLGQTIGMGIFFGLISAGPAIFGAIINATHKETPIASPIKEIQTVCPNCGTVFQSNPLICYKCNAPLNISNNLD